MKEKSDLFLDVFCPLLSLDEQLCSMFRLPSLSMIVRGGAAASSCPTSSTSYGAILSQHLQDAASSSSSASSTEPTPELGCGPVTVALKCINSGSCSYVVMVMVTVLGMYLLVAVLVNLVACYNFVVAWNLIARMYHVDLTFMSGAPRSSASSSSSSSSSSMRSLASSHAAESPSGSTQTHRTRAWRVANDGNSSRCSHDDLVSAASMRDTCCPVCLEEFYEMEKVSTCEDGCEAWFHRACLAEWLDRSDSCPCCRRDMVTAPRYQSRGCWHDLTVFLGYAPAR